MINSKLTAQKIIEKETVELKSIDLPTTLWDEILLTLRKKEYFPNVSENDYETAIGYYFQGRTFYNSAKNDNDYTFPLNLFYAFNNLVKACILMKKGTCEANCHGASFKIEDNVKQIDYDKYKITIRNNGVFGQLLEILPYKDYCSKILFSNKTEASLKLTDVLKRLYYISSCSLPNDGHLTLRNKVNRGPLHKSYILADNNYKSPLNSIEIAQDKCVHDSDAFTDLRKATDHVCVYFADKDYRSRYKKCLLHLENDSYGIFYLIPKVEVCQNKSKIDVFFEQLALSYLITLSASSIVRYHGELWNSILRDKDNIESSALLILLKDFFYSIPLKVLDLLTGKTYIIKN